MKKIGLGILGVVGIFILLVVVAGVVRLDSADEGGAIPDGNTSDTLEFREAEARLIAEQTCIKGGESLGAGIYNEGTKTWWYDANLNVTKPGCNPACVVDEKTKIAEINWRCTGLLEPVACTMDAMQCPDGSYVGRSGPNCEFICP